MTSFWSLKGAWTLLSHFIQQIWRFIAVSFSGYNLLQKLYNKSDVLKIVSRWYILACNFKIRLIFFIQAAFIYVSQSICYRTLIKLTYHNQSFEVIIPYFLTLLYYFTLTSQRGLSQVGIELSLSHYRRNESIQYFSLKRGHSENDILQVSSENWK